MKTLFLCVVLAIIGGSQTATAKNPLQSSLLVNKLKKEIWDKKAMKYLMTYGYIQEDEDVNPDSVSAALKRMQTMAHVKVTGEMNEETSRSMNLKRCGVPDEFPGDKNHPDSKQKRHYYRRGVWRKRDLTYKFVQMTRDMDTVSVKGVIEAAFDSWARHIPLTFTEGVSNSDPVDIEISFVYGKHNSKKFNYCRKIMDGPGTVLARGYFPCYSRTTKRNLCGDIHIDDSERWGIEYNDGQPLQNTIAHEIGHTLGLHHSKYPSSLMYYAATRNSPKEPVRDDIHRIQRLYPTAERLISRKSRCHPSG